jgi:nitronate monooxygenase
MGASAFDVWGARLPLIQAPMAGAQDAGLALAACEAGALGSLPAAMLDRDDLQRELSRLQAARRPYNVNFFTHDPAPLDATQDGRWRARLAPYYLEFGLDPARVPGPVARRPFDAASAEVLEAFRPAVVSFHFGLPSPALLARVKRTGAVVLSSATTVAEGVWLQAHGADAVIAQGLEAGGHRGHFLSADVNRQSNLRELLPRMVAALDVPVIAAGGIADAVSVRSALAQGAAAVQVGTAFLACTETTIGARHRARLLDASATTVLTNVFTGGLARGFVNRAVRELGPVSEAAPPFPYAAAAIAPLRGPAERRGRDDFTPMWSGTNRSGCAAVPAGHIVRALTAALPR